MKTIIKNYLEISKRIEKIENLLLDAIDDKYYIRKINFALCDIYSLKKDLETYRRETLDIVYWKIWELKNNGNEKETN